MKKIYFLAFLFLCTFLTIGTNTAWGETETITFTDKDWSPWTNITSGSSFEASNSARGVANNKVNGSCKSPKTYNNITKIELVCSSNATGGKVAVLVGTQNVGTKDIINSNNTTYTYDVSDLSGVITIKVTNPSSRTVWVKSISITTAAASKVSLVYNANGSTGGTVPPTLEYDKGATVTVAGNTGGLVKTGFDFAGWNTSADGSGTTYQGGSTFAINANTTLYALWTAQSNKLSTPTNLKTTDITSNGAKLSWDAVPHATKYIVTYAETNSSAIKVDVTSTTYVLSGLPSEATYLWTVKAVGDATYEDSEESSTAEFTTLPTPYTITWSTPDGTDTKQVTPGDKVVLPAAPTSCSSTYTNFVGWFTEAAGSESNPSTAKPATQVTAATVPTGDATYYAVFSDATGDGTTTVFSETFNKANGTGGNDNNWSGNIATTDWDVTQCDNTSGWTVSSVNFANACIKAGSGSKQGSVQTPSITISGNATITFLAGAWNGKDEKTTLSISATNGKLSQTSVTMKKGEWTSYTITLSDVTSATTRLTFAAANSANNRFFLDEIKVVVSSTTPATGYISSCCNDPAVVTVTPATTTINLGEDGKATTTVTCTQQNGGTAGTWSYSVSPSTATFDGTNFVATAAGEYTLTATYTETCGKSGMATITVTNTPVLYFPTPTPADPIVFGTVECGGNTPLTDKQTISLRGYNLTSDVTVTVTGDYKIAGTESAELADYATSLTLPKDAVSGSSASVYVISTPPMQSSSPTTGKVTFATAGGNTLEVNLSTPDITCTEYTLTLNDRGTTTSAGNYLAGAGVPKPTDPTGVCTEPINYIFDGWATAEVAEGSTTYTKVSFPYTMPAANTTLYAVYKYEGNTISDTQFGRGTLDDLVDGQKVVIVEQDAKKALNSKTYQSYYLTATAVTINNDLIDVTNNALIWELKKNGSNYSFLQDGKYLNITESSTHYNLTVTSQEDSWSIVAFGDGYSLQSTTYADYYAVYNSKYTEYTTDKTAYALQFYVPVAIQEYTTAPSCTPCIKGTDDITVTSAQGIWVEAVTPLNITATNLDKNADGANVTITATSLTGGFTLKTQGINGSGSESVTLETDYSNSIYNANLMVVYSPTADNIIEEGKIALRVYRTNGTTTYATDTIIVRGRSLPAEFVLAAETTNGWVALPADLGTSSTDAVKEPYTISVDDGAAPTKATLAPQSALYSAAMRSTVNAIPTGLRFKAGEKYLQGSQSKGETKVWLSSTDSEQMQSWELHSSNLIDYFVRLRAAEEGRYLSYNATQGKIANYKQESRLRILPVENTCVRYDAPNINVHALISTSVTFVWEAIAGVTDYEYSLDGEKTWQPCSDIETPGTEVKWTLANLKSETKYTVYIRAKVADGKSNCSASDSETFTTPTCDDVPVDLWVSPTANAATIMWSAKAPTATVKIYADEQGTKLVQETPNATTPCKIIGLEQNTDYYYQVLAGGSCASAIAHFKTESNEVSIVEWKKDAVIVDLNTEVTDADEVSILVEGQKTHGTNNNVADDLFFSKYYEASGNVKLVAIYNGTKDTLSLANVKIKLGVTAWNTNVISMSDYGRYKHGFIAPNEEIIVWYYNGSFDQKIVKCVKDKMNINILNENSAVSFSGKQTFALVRDSKIIDIMGAIDTKDTDVDKVKPIEGGCKPEWGDITKNDAVARTWCGEGYSIEDKTTLIDLAMNRCLLVRSNKVKSGAKAVANNVGAFKTFTKDEWLGRQVTEGDDNGVTESCNGFAYVADFNYNDYYTTYDSIANLEIKGNRNEDGTYTIPIPKLDTMACTNLRLQLKKKGTIQATREEKVPIIVNQNTNTEDPAFFGGKLTDEICKTCDVVVRDNAQLLHTAGGKQKFRDMYVYTGSSLNIPENQTMSLDKVRMFATNDNVSYAIVNNSNATAAAISVKEVSHVKRIDGRYWYPFSLPYDCNIADIDQLNGQPLGVYGTDWGIKYYDGYKRQKDGNSTTHYGEVSKYWTMMPEDGQLKAYTGYIIGLFVPAADEPLMKSVNFPPATESAYTENADAKTTPITNWPDNLTAQPRHHGWNFVGSPYISLFGSNNNTQGEGLYNTQVQMGWTDALGNQQDKDHIYVSTPDGGNSNTYTQALASGVTILPFSAYFVQAIDPIPGQSNTLQLTYSKANRHLLAPARVQNAEPLILTELDITNGALRDNTGVLVSNVYSAEYEIGDDLTKMYAAAQKPQLYTIDAHNDKMAYQALPDVLAHAIPLGIYVPQAGNYTLSLNRYVSRLEAAEAVYLLHNGAVVANLLLSDYIVSASAKGTISGYSLDIRRAPEVVTDIVPAAGDAPYIIARDGVLAIANTPADAVVQVYDVLGHRLLQTDTHAAGTLQVPVPQTGVYTVVITTADGQQVLKTLLR